MTKFGMAEMILAARRVAGGCAVGRVMHSGDALVVADDSAATLQGANLSRCEADSAGWRLGVCWLRFRAEWPVVVALVRSFGVVVRGVVVEDAAQAAVSETPAAAEAFVFDGADPAFGEGVQVGAAWRGGDRFDAGLVEGIFPGGGEIGAAVMDDVFGADPLQPSVVAGDVAGGLDHEGFVGVFGDAEYFDYARGQVDGEQDVIGGVLEESDDIDGEEVGGDDAVVMVGDEGIPGGFAVSVRCGCDAVAFEDGGDGACGDADAQGAQFALDAFLSPGGIFARHADDRLFDFGIGFRSSGFRARLPEFSPQHQPMPAVDGGSFGDGGDLCEALPADSGRDGGSGSGEAFAPGVSEMQGVVFGDLCAQVGDFGAHIGEFRQQGLVLLGQNRRRDEAGQKRQVLHGWVHGLRLRGFASREILDAA